jgi:hypothetical protein
MYNEPHLPGVDHGNIIRIASYSPNKRRYYLLSHAISAVCSMHAKKDMGTFV